MIKANLLWVAVCRRYPFIREFATEVLREHFLVLRRRLVFADFDHFLNAKALWHAELDDIAKSTQLKLRQNLFRMLREADLLSDQYEIHPAQLSPISHSSWPGRGDRFSWSSRPLTTTFKDGFNDLEDQPPTTRQPFRSLDPGDRWRALLQMRGLNNDLPFYICEFRANEAFEMQRMQRQLISSLANLQVPCLGGRGVQVLEINLYDLCVELLQAREGSSDGGRLWDEVLAIEPDAERTTSLNCCRTFWASRTT